MRLAAPGQTSSSCDSVEGCSSDFQRGLPLAILIFSLPNSEAPTGASTKKSRMGSSPPSSRIGASAWLLAASQSAMN